MQSVGFEPTHPKITELKSAALDHSANQANLLKKLKLISKFSTVTGLEPATAGSEVQRAIQLRHTVHIN